VDDRITIEFSAEGDLAKAISAHEDYIRQETLANSLTQGSGEGFETVKIASEEIALRLAKA
jgi:isoleucyl-tRNA synthetase